MERDMPKAYSSSALLYLFESVKAHGDSDECLVWPRPHRPDGYSAFNVSGNTVYVHRLSFIIFVGNPRNSLVLHKCDNRSCYSPRHLFLGSQNDNKQDAVAKKRHAHGETHARHKLTEKQVREIRSLHSQGGWTLRRLAQKYCVSNGAIQNLLNGKNWRHIH
jgi:hypothetical protein